MRIPAQARVWWTPGLTVYDVDGKPLDLQPAPTGWEASFDGGLTWHPSRDNAGRPGWLIAGADYPGPGDSDDGTTADHVVIRTVSVQVRLRDTPETLIDDTLWLQKAT